MKKVQKSEKASRTPAHGVARGSLPQVAQRVRVAGVHEANEGLQLRRCNGLME